MRVRETVGHGTCEACEEKDVDVQVVTFDRAEEVYLLCGSCLEWTRTLLGLLDVKESEA